MNKTKFSITPQKPIKIKYANDTFCDGTILEVKPLHIIFAYNDNLKQLYRVSRFRVFNNQGTPTVSSDHVHRIFSKKYLKMNRDYKKKLLKGSKDWGPWDFCWIECFVTDFICWMRDYYEDGENVWAMEERECNEGLRDAPSRLESIEGALDLWDKYQKLEDTWHSGQTYEQRIESGMNVQAAYEAFWTYIGKHMREWWD